MMASTDFTSSGLGAGTPAKGSGAVCAGAALCGAGFAAEGCVAAKDAAASAAVNAASASFMSRFSNVVSSCALRFFGLDAGTIYQESRRRAENRDDYLRKWDKSHRRKERAALRTRQVTTGK